MDQLKRNIDWIENNPNPQGFIDLRLYINELEADQKRKDNGINDTLSELWSLVTQAKLAMRDDYAAACLPLFDMEKLLQPYADNWVESASRFKCISPE